MTRKRIPNWATKPSPWWLKLRWFLAKMLIGRHGAIYQADITVLGVHGPCNVLVGHDTWLLIEACTLREPPLEGLEQVDSYLGRH